tara:strand:- start:360 stop:641 length:282 start_codon:yes stop_codon:yes gene_type:complete
MNLDNWFPRIKRWRGSPRYNKEDGEFTHGVFDDVEMTSGACGGMRVHYHRGILEHSFTRDWLENGLPEDTPCFLLKSWGYYPPLPLKLKKKNI